MSFIEIAVFLSVISFCFYGFIVENYVDKYYTRLFPIKSLLIPKLAYLLALWIIIVLNPSRFLILFNCNTLC